MTTNTDALQRAIAYLRVKEVAPQRWAYYASETQRYYIVSEDALAQLPGYLDREQAARDRQDGHIGAGEGGYSEWCADTQQTEMPVWWTPERRSIDYCDHVGEEIDPCPDGDDCVATARYTASLETGEEVSA
jgi:hypothetical protein